jgi:hypothetical protein
VKIIGDWRGGGHSNGVGPNAVFLPKKTLSVFFKY